MEKRKMNKDSKVTLVTTVFNDEKNISQFIENIIGQTVQPDEIIIVDGGSKDKTVDIIKSFNNPRIKVLTNGRMNIARGLNYGIRESNNEVITICLAGVKYDTTWFEKLTQPILSGEADISATYYGILAQTPYAETYKHFVEMKNRSAENFLPSSRSIAYKKKCMVCNWWLLRRIYLCR